MPEIIKVIPSVQTNIDNTNSTSIDAVFVMFEDGKWGMNKHFKPLDAIWSGDGWWIDIQHEKIVKELCEQAQMPWIHNHIPAPDWTTFKRQNSTQYFKGKLGEVYFKIEEIKKTFNFDFPKLENDLFSLKKDEIDLLNKTDHGKDLINKVEQYQKIQNRLHHLRNEELVHSIQAPQSKIEIGFIKDLTPNPLTTEAPDAPTLLSIIDGSNVKPFLRKGIVGQLVGAGGIGKTHWLTQLAFSVATRRKFLDIYSVGLGGHVFLGLGENSQDDIRRLLRKMVLGLKLVPQEIERAANQLAVRSFHGTNAAFIYKGEPTSYFYSLFEALKKSQPENGWDLIIFDPISRFLGAEAETDNAAATQFIALLEKMTIELNGNPTILFGHHMSKMGVLNSNTDQTAARGSSALTDGVRWQANLEKGEGDGETRFKVVKSNFTAITPAQILKKDEYGCLEYSYTEDTDVKATQVKNLPKNNKQKQPSTFD